jgi:hypothetical protein
MAATNSSRIKRPIRIEGDLAYITLTRGYETVIDAADVHLVAEFQWAVCPRPGKSTYAMRTDGRGGKKRSVFFHRVLMGEPLDMRVDHIDCNGLNNRRSNLRLATISQSNHNSRTPRHNTSGLKGVSWHKREKKWSSYINVNRQRHHLGLHATADLAHAAYCEASARLHGEFGRTI